MTRKEKVMQMDPADVKEEYEGGVFACLFNYSYLNLKERNFKKCGKQFREGTLEDADCEACWNAEWKEQQGPVPVQTEAIEPEEEKDGEDSKMGTTGTVPDEPRRAEKHREKEKPVGKIAPAQMEKKHEENHSETSQKWAKNEGEKEKPRSQESRANYMKVLSTTELARYIADQYAAGAFDRWKDAANRFSVVGIWLSEKVDGEGRKVDE